MMGRLGWPGCAGIPAFIELIDVDAAHSLGDPFKARVEEMLK